jgi:hypothetical protein
MRTEITALKEMIESCYTYGGADRNSYNFDKYIKQYESGIGKEMFEKTYTEHLSLLKAKYTIQSNVYTDSDGLSYNSLIKHTLKN